MRRVKVEYLTDNPLGENLCLIDGKVYIEFTEEDGSHVYSYMCRAGESFVYEEPKTFAGDSRLLEELFKKRKIATYVNVSEEDEYIVNE